MREDLGQALIETAVTLPVMLVLFLGFLAVGVVAEALVDLNTAVYLAAASAAAAPAGQAATARDYATWTFDDTVANFPELQVGGTGIDCTSDPNGFGAGAQVTCVASAELRFDRTLFAIVVPTNPRLSATATAVIPEHRGA